MFENEECWVLIGDTRWPMWWGKMRRRTEGQPQQVGFDAAWVIEQDEQHQNVMGFYHTHPGMPAYPSTIDRVTMHAWINCLGRPLFCCIRGIDGLKAWLYINDETPPVLIEPAKRFGRYIVGVFVSDEETTEGTEEIPECLKGDVESDCTPETEEISVATSAEPT